jgi:hypothetical protein
VFDDTRITAVSYQRARPGLKIHETPSEKIWASRVAQARSVYNPRD